MMEHAVAPHHIEAFVHKREFHQRVLLKAEILESFLDRSLPAAFMLVALRSTPITSRAPHCAIRMDPRPPPQPASRQRFPLNTCELMPLALSRTYSGSTNSSKVFSSYNENVSP